MYNSFWMFHILHFILTTVLWGEYCYTQYMYENMVITQGPSIRARIEPLAPLYTIFLEKKKRIGDILMVFNEKHSMFLFVFSQEEQ